MVIRRPELHHMHKQVSTCSDVLLFMFHGVGVSLRLSIISRIYICAMILDT